MNLLHYEDPRWDTRDEGEYTTIEYVKRLYKQGYSIDTISRCAEISNEEVRDILEEWDE
jgi:hypothetical protein